MSPVARLLACCALLLGLSTGQASADDHADAGYLLMTRAMSYGGTWGACPNGVNWGGGATLVLAGQETGTYDLWIGGYAEFCPIGGEYGSISVSGPIYGALTYARIGTSIGIGGWLVIAGHPHRVGASVIEAVPTSAQPTWTDAWAGAIVLR